MTGIWATTGPMATTGLAAEMLLLLRSCSCPIPQSAIAAVTGTYFRCVMLHLFGECLPRCRPCCVNIRSGMARVLKPQNVEIFIPELPLTERERTFHGLLAWNGPDAFSHV